MSEQRDAVERLTAMLNQLRQCTAWKGFSAPQTDIRVKSPAFLIEDLGDALAEIASLRAQVEGHRAVLNLKCAQLEQQAEKIAELDDMRQAAEAQLASARKALTWIKANCGAHPRNIVKVIEQYEGEAGCPLTDENRRSNPDEGLPTHEDVRGILAQKTEEIREGEK